MTSSQVHSQSRLGHQKVEIMEEFLNPMFNMRETNDSDGKTMIIIDIEEIDVNVAYIFDKSNVVATTLIHPTSIESLIRLKLKYDRKYSRVSSDQWVAKFDEMSARIDLIEKDGLEYFIWNELYPY